MGCASSTPMIATAGSDMLKAATHAASDAAKGAEHAVEEVTETVGKTLENAKETVGTAVTGIAHDLGNVFTEKSGELDTAKNQLLERLHLGNATKALEHANESAVNHLDTTALEMAARAPTPPPDLDSLKTSTPEPEIERALANSHEDMPPTPKPTIAELEKLTAEVKQTTQTTTALAAAATNVVAEAKDTTELATGLTAATEPAVDMIALLAAEKRPGTTEWEKHADHLSKTRKMNEFKGGGKFRRFGPPTQPANYHKPQPANYHKPIENLRRTLLEDDSCYSDAYYNSNSSPQHSTASDSPRLRRARLPINGVLAVNAKRMQREFATFVSNRRNVTSALRSLTVSPAISRHFDYNPQRPRISSPTPSVIGYTRSGYSTPVIMKPELLPNPRTASWKRGASSSGLHSPPSHIGKALPRVIAPLDPQLAANVISQSKLKSTKAFASLRGETKGRSRIFGQTRSGSPVNRRVFARRSGSPPASKGRILYARSGSPERIRALMQDKVETKNKVKPLAETPTKIRLERKASIKESKEVNSGELSTNGFSLAEALSPIKMAAESHSLPHLKSEEKTTTLVAHSLMEVVEQAVERAKNDGDTLDVKNGKEHAHNVEALKIKKETPVKHERQKEILAKAVNTEKKNGEKKSANVKSVNIQTDVENEKSLNKEPIKRGNKSNMWLENKDTSNSNTSSSRSEKPVPSPVRRNSKSSSTVESKGNNNAIKLKSKPSPSRQKSNSSQNNEEYTQMENLAIRGRFSMSPKKKSPAHHEKTHNLWENTSPGRKDLSSSHSRALETNFSTNDGSTQITSRLTESRSPINNKVRGISARGKQLNQESKTTINNDRYSNKNNWNSSSRRNSKGEYTNISNRFEYNATLSSLPKEKLRTPRKYNTSSPYHEKQGPKEVEKQNYFSQLNGEGNNGVKKVTGNESIRGTKFNLNYANKGYHDEQSSLLFKENLNNIENIKYRSERIDGPRREIPINTSRTSRSSPVTNSIKSHEQNNGEHRSKHITNHMHNLKETLRVNDHLSTNQTNNEENVQNKETPTNQFTNSPIKQIKDTSYSPSHKSHNSSPSKSSKSSSSIIIRTNLSTPETEDYDEEALNRELSQELQQLKHYDDVTRDERNFSRHASIEEDSQTDLEEYSSTDHEESTRIDYEGALHTDADVSSHADVDNYSAASTSMEDLINTLSPQTAYFNLDRSATMMPLKAKTSILKPPLSLFHSPSHSSSYRRHSSSYESDQLEKVLFIGELSKVARSRSARALNPYEMSDRCDVCYNKYVIK